MSYRKGSDRGSEKFAPYPGGDRSRGGARKPAPPVARPAARPASGGKGSKGAPPRRSVPAPSKTAATPASAPKQVQRGSTFMPFLEEQRTAACQQLHFPRPALSNAACYHSYAAGLPSVTPVSYSIADTHEAAGAAFTAITAQAGPDEINVRLLLPLSKEATPTQNDTGLLVTKVNNKHVCYGGVVKNGELPQIVEAAKQLFMEQTGVDFAAVADWDRVCKIDYEDTEGSPTYSSLYLMPDASQLGTVALKKLVESQTETYTVQVEVEEEEEVEEDGEEKDEEGNPVKVTVVKKIKKKVPEERTRTKTKELLVPSVLLYSVFASTGTYDGEVARAFDMLQEAMRYLSINAIIRFLQTKDKREEEANEQEQKNEQGKKDLAAALKALETKRDADFAAKKAEMQKEWDEEDEGETLDEIESKADARSKLKKEVCKGFFDKCQEEMNELRKKKVDVKEIVSGIDEEAYEAFALFAGTGKSLPKETLINAALAADTELCTWEAMAYFEALESRVNFGDVCKVRTVKQPQGDVEMADGEAPADEQVDEGEEDAPMADESGDVEMEEDGKENDEEPADDDAGEDAMDAEDDFGNLSYRELQAACKERRLSSQGKASVLRDRLRGKEE